MTCRRLLLVPLVLAALAPAAPAGIFSRKSKPNPGERVPELLLQVQSAADEGRRAAAAEELRQFDAKEFPRIIPVLIDALGRDASPAVRVEAATTLGKVRPISQQAGYALEQAQNNDGVMRVRLAARQALWQYHLVGYRGGKSAEAMTANGAPEAAAASQRPATPVRTQPPHGPGFGGRETAEPPLADPGPAKAMPAVRQRVVSPPAPSPNSNRSVPPPAPAAGSNPAPPDAGPALPPP